MAHIQKRQQGGKVRYYVRWRIDGREKVRSFARARDAETFRRQVEHDQFLGLHVDPSRGAVTFGAYAEEWLRCRRRADGRPLAPRTAELYRYQLDRFLLPTLGGRPLRSIRTDHVREMHTRVSEQASPLQAAKAYRLLRVILNTAVEDERITHNPCKLRGAGVERSPERPFVDVDLVLALAAAIDQRYSCFVLLAGFGGLRLGELLALRRHHIDLERRSVTVTVQTVELNSGERLTTAPKTDAGRRVVHLPVLVAAALAVHLDRYVGPDGDALVFTGPRSSELRRATFYREWARARSAVGLDHVHLHDLRHAAGTLAAQTGATTRELMARLGHATPAASHRYQHAAARRDARIAAALDDMVDPARAASLPLMGGRCGAPGSDEPAPQPDTTAQRASDQHL